MMDNLEHIQKINQVPGFLLWNDLEKFVSIITMVLKTLLKGDPRYRGTIMRLHHLAYNA